MRLTGGQQVRSTCLGKGLKSGLSPVRWREREVGGEGGGGREVVSVLFWAVCVFIKAARGVLCVFSCQP